MEDLIKHNRYLLKDWVIDHECDCITFVIKQGIDIDDDNVQDFLHAVYDYSIQYVSMQYVINDIQCPRVNIDIARETCGFIDELLYVYNIERISPTLIKVIKINHLCNRESSIIINI